MSKLFDDLKAGLNEALDHAQGLPIAGRERTISIEASEVREARLRAGMTQKQFSQVLGASLDTLRKWEQGSRSPSGAAARLIRIISYRPSIVREALGVLPDVAKRSPRRVA